MSAREQEAVRRTGCPKCGVKAGTMCVYVTPSYVPQYQGRVTQERLSKVGTPMKRPHFQRTNKLTELQRRTANKVRLADIQRSTPAALFSLREYDRREMEKMKAWLRTNWWLFMAPKARHDGK